MVGRSKFVLGLGGLFLLCLFPAPARAAAFTVHRDYLSRQQASLSSGEAHQLFFTPDTAVSGTGNTVTLEFPDDEDATWCATAGIDLVVTGIINPDGATEGATPLPGTLTGSCTQGAGTNSVDTITIDGVGALSSGVKYGVGISEGTVAKLGTPPPVQGLTVTLSTKKGPTVIDTDVFYMSVISSDQVAVSATVASTNPVVPTNPDVQFSGFASPSAAITIVRDGTNIATTTADADAKFSVTVSNQPTGSVIYDVTGVDGDGQSLAPVTFALTLSQNTTTIISGVFLGPSIGIDKTSVKIGTPVTVSGQTAPGSSVTLTVHSTHAASFTVTANAQGEWSKTVDTTTIGVGTHTAQAQAIMGGTTASEFSSMVTFAVNPQGVCDSKPTADLNCDGRVNIVDFSILLFFWRQTNPSNVRADINRDGHVDITDFSIMLFQWTG